MVQRQCGRRGWGAAETAALASSVGGGVASLATQSVIVPVDVVSCKHPSSPPYAFGGAAAALHDICLLSMWNLCGHSGVITAAAGWVLRLQVSVSGCLRDPTALVSFEISDQRMPVPPEAPSDLLMLPPNFCRSRSG